MPRGVFDLEDLVARAEDLADFVGAASQAYGFDRDNVVAVGFSNGANVAAGASVELRWHPGGHQLPAEVLDAARAWLLNLRTATGSRPLP